MWLKIPQGSGVWGEARLEELAGATLHRPSPGAVRKRTVRVPFVRVTCVPHCRAEEVPVCHLLPVWPDLGYPGVTEPEDEGPGLCHL